MYRSLLFTTITTAVLRGKIGSKLMLKCTTFEILVSDLNVFQSQALSTVRFQSLLR
jgi:hypothetical protein